MHDITLSLPRLNCLTPTFESACIKLCEEMGEVARIIGKGQGLNGESKSVVLKKQEFINELGSELFDVAQSAMTMLYLFQDEYNLDIDKFYNNHIDKLIAKGYLKERPTVDPIFDHLGNIVNLAIPDYDIITEEDSILVANAKREAQQNIWDQIHNVKHTEGEGNEIP